MATTKNQLGGCLGKQSNVGSVSDEAAWGALRASTCDCCSGGFCWCQYWVALARTLYGVCGHCLVHRVAAASGVLPAYWNPKRQALSSGTYPYGYRWSLSGCEIFSHSHEQQSVFGVDAAQFSGLANC